MRVGGRVTPRIWPTRSLKLSFACAFSTLSRKLSVSGVDAGIVSLVPGEERGSASGSWYAPWALAADGDEDAAARAGGVGGVVREVGAAHDAQDGLGVDDEGEADGVLLAAEEAFCAVDGVEGPHAWMKKFALVWLLM